MKSTIKKWIAVVLTLSIFAPALSFAQVQLQGPRDSIEIYSGVVYGPIDQNDTLWRIASRYKQDSQFSVYQTMLAIYQLNPQAFENNNFNTMVNGATLQLPSDRYIARIDPQRARAKAETDDRAFGRPNSVQPEEVFDEVAAAAAEPEVPLVNQQDLTSTKEELQRQLNSLNRQQTAQFDEIKNQVATSISSVQALIEENRRLYDRLDQVNQDISDLRGKVEGEVQEQIDQQLVLQKEIIDLVKQAEQRQLEKESQSIWTTLSSPMAIIALSSIVTVGILAFLFYWLLRKPKQAPDKNEKAPEAEQTDIVDDELIIGEMEDDDDADDLMAALDQEMDDDDILSSDLEDGLDELGVGDTDFGDVDDMLVPDTKASDKEDAAKAHVIEEEVSFDTDAISLDDDDFENQEIDLTPPEQKDPKASEQQETNGTSSENVNASDASTDEEETSAAEQNTTADENIESEESETENEPEPRQQSNRLSSMQNDMPSGVPIDESAAIDEEAIEHIENAINEATQEFENLSSDILNELENVVDDDADLDEIIEPAEVDELDAELSNEFVSTQETTAEEQKDAEQPELEQEITNTEQDEAEQEAQDLEILEQEQEQEQEPAQETSDVASIDSALEETNSEQLEAEQETNKNEPSQAEQEGETDLQITEPEEAKLITDPEDEEDEDATEKELDQLLEQFTQDAEPDTSIEDDKDLAIEDEPDDLANTMADELLAELESEDSVSDDDLDALLDEFTEELGNEPDDDITSRSSFNIDDSDALLDDIPTLGTLNKTEKPNNKRNAKTEKAKDKEPANKQSESADDDSSSASEESDEDVLADLPGLDDWLGEEDLEDELQEDLQSITNDGEINNELNVLADIEGSDFEELLSEIDADNQHVSDDLKAFENAAADEGSDILSESGLDLDSLMQDDESADESVESFVNVDDLLSESEALTPLKDEDIELNLHKSLSRMSNSDVHEDGEEHASQAQEDILAEQGSNLDLAQVYIDMDDFDAAIEVLEEVKLKGSAEQVEEAMQLLQSIKNV